MRLMADPPEVQAVVEAGKCLLAAAVMADSYGKPTTAAAMRKARHDLLTTQAATSDGGRPLTDPSGRSVLLQKRQHSDGFVLWDVMVADEFAGTARQHAVAAPSWFAYGPHGEDCGRHPLRRDAVAALVAVAEVAT